MRAGLRLQRRQSLLLLMPLLSLIRSQLLQMLLDRSLGIDHAAVPCLTWLSVPVVPQPMQIFMRSRYASSLRGVGR